MSGYFRPEQDPNIASSGLTRAAYVPASPGPHYLTETHSIAAKRPYAPVT